MKNRISLQQSVGSSFIKQASLIVERTPLQLRICKRHFIGANTAQKTGRKEASRERTKYKN